RCHTGKAGGKQGHRGGFGNGFRWNSVRPVGRILGVVRRNPKGRVVEIVGLDEDLSYSRGSEVSDHRTGKRTVHEIAERIRCQIKAHGQSIPGTEIHGVTEIHPSTGIHVVSPESDETEIGESD